ncbi:MAG TPA: hypothetical protein VNT03_10310 [Baekduia sp.]|nr:hypothetical protein [Baekduia sp.]
MVAILALTSTATLLLAVSPAGAVTNPMPITGQAPADKLVAPASNYPVATAGEMLTFSVDVPEPLSSDTIASVEISSSPALGQDGTLSDDDNVATLQMAASDKDPRHYVATTEPFNAWLGKPGTYYWMVHHFTIDLDACAAGCTWVSTVRSFRLTAPKLVLGKAEAEEQASNALAQRYGKKYTSRAIDVRISCAKRLSATVRRCTASWQRKGTRYRARLDIVEHRGGEYAYRNAKLTPRR